MTHLFDLDCQYQADFVNLLVYCTEGISATGGIVLCSPTEEFLISFLIILLVVGLILALVSYI